MMNHEDLAEALRQSLEDEPPVLPSFVATLVDVTGLVIYFTVAFAVMHGTIL